jgi:hypothetical protein
MRQCVLKKKRNPELNLKLFTLPNQNIKINEVMIVNDDEQYEDLVTQNVTATTR